MNKDNISTFLISLYLCIFCLILSPKRSYGAHYQYEACVPTNCESGPNISFPFHVPGLQESYCGSPGFVLTCTKDGFPVLKLSDNDYVVEDIFYQNRSLRLVNEAVLRSDGSSCLPRIRNTTLLAAPQFNYVNFTCLHFLSGCRQPLPEELLRYNVSCDSSEDGSTWALALYDSDENLRNAMEMCSRNVVAPVEWENDGILNLAEALRGGFVLNWTASDCSTCENSGGRCGFDETTYVFRCFCPDRPHSRSCPPGKRQFKKVLLIGGLSVAAFSATSIILLVLVRKKYVLIPQQLRLGKAKTGREKDIEIFLKNHGNLAQKRYKYSDLKKMTNSFGEILGKGGYGSVYKGKLADGRLVAVKILNESEGNGEEFVNEVASISRTSHVNIVTLLGFCFEGSKRALIYDFMPNGSLEKFIQSSTSSEGGLGWKIMFEIAVGIARGLEYLHRGCNMRILHFDIKPHNILLDQDLNPKISDFGLAKLCPNRSSIVSMLAARGTIGYIAPEVFYRNFGEVSHKSDVYSYGMLVLEMAVGRQNIDRRTDSQLSEMYFPDWVYKRLEVNNVIGFDGIVNEDEGQLARKMTIVGLWCIQTVPKNRPSISRVVEMLEGSLESLQIPPKPFLFPPPAPVDNSSASEPTISQKF